jgi:hypothetical protein
MTKITGGSLIRRVAGPIIPGTAGCLVQWAGKTDRLLLLTAAGKSALLQDDVLTPG